MNPAKPLVRNPQKARLLTASQFQQLAEVPPEIEWFRNLNNPHTERSYRNAIADFMRFTGIRRPEEFRVITRSHVIAWRDEMARRYLDRATVRQRLSALASLFEFLCDKNAVTHNPVISAFVAGSSTVLNFSVIGSDMPIDPFPNKPLEFDVRETRQPDEWVDRRTLS